MQNEIQYNDYQVIMARRTSFGSVLARSEFGRWTGLYKCTVQCTAVQSTVLSGLQHCSHSRLGREAVRDCPE